MSAPQNQTIPGVPGPSATLNFSDPSTWVAIVVAVGGVAAVAWPGLNLSPIVQAVALLVPGIVAAAVLFSKHQLAAGVAAAAALMPQSVAVEQAVVGAARIGAAAGVTAPPLPVAGVIPPLP